MADRFDKAIVAQRLKLAEIGVAGHRGARLLAAFACRCCSSALFLFGIIAALFGPIKYGILPDHLQSEELPAGNALVEGATFMAILLGTIAGGLAAKDGGDPALFAALIMVFSLLCWGASLLIPRTGAGARPTCAIDPNIVALDRRAAAATLRDDRGCGGAALVTSWFWLVGAVALSLLPPLVKNVLGGDRGSRDRLPRGLLGRDRDRLGARRLARAWPHRAAADAGRRRAARRVRARSRLVHLRRRADRRSLPAIAPFFSPARGIHVAIDLAGLAIAGGLFIVPAFAAVQAWAGADRRARVVAAVNVLNAAFMAGGALVVAALQTAGLTLPALFAAARRRQPRRRRSSIGRTMPTNAFRDFLSIMLRALFRIEVKGLENLAQGRPERHHRAQPCELPRRRRSRCRCSTASRSSPSTTASRSAGG